MSDETTTETVALSTTVMPEVAELLSVGTLFRVVAIHGPEYGYHQFRGLHLATVPARQVPQAEEWTTAWLEVVDALPEGWSGPAVYPKPLNGGWHAEAFNDAIDDLGGAHGEGDTHIAALRALADALRQQASGS